MAQNNVSRDFLLVRRTGDSTLNDSNETNDTFLGTGFFTVAAVNFLSIH